MKTIHRLFQAEKNSAQMQETEQLLLGNRSLRCSTSCIHAVVRILRFIF